jgi:hypothetical protein
MATTTFDKRIELNEATADRLIEILKNPPPPSPRSEAKFLSEEEAIEGFSKWTRSSKAAAKKISAD